MDDRAQWKRVSRARPCPICGKPDWCTFVGPDDAPEAVLCPRMPDGSRGWKGADGGGYLHVLREQHDSERQSQPRPKRPPEPPPEPEIDAAGIAKRSMAALSDRDLANLAEQLGLSMQSLRRLRVGWSGHHRAWTFPMQDAFGGVRGVRLRGQDGKKWSVKGGREGLFVPDGLDGSELLMICEGPTDCAALLDMGVEAVGRPSCSGGTKHLRWLVAARAPSEVVIVHDRDEPGSTAERATVNGAERLATMLASMKRTLRIIQPPEGIKDARSWLQQGANEDDLMAVVDAAQPRRLRRGDWLKRLSPNPQ